MSKNPPGTCSNCGKKSVVKRRSNGEIVCNKCFLGSLEPRKTRVIKKGRQLKTVFVMPKQKQVVRGSCFNPRPR